MSTKPDKDDSTEKYVDTEGASRLSSYSVFDDIPFIKSENLFNKQYTQSSLEQPNLFHGTKKSIPELVQERREKAEHRKKIEEFESLATKEFANAEEFRKAAIEAYTAIDPTGLLPVMYPEEIFKQIQPAEAHLYKYCKSSKSYYIDADNELFLKASNLPYVNEDSITIQPGSLIHGLGLNRFENIFGRIPDIIRTSGAEHEERKKELLEKGVPINMLSSFEVDLYSCYPSTMPIGKNRKHSVRFIKELSNVGYDFVFLDTETTGMNDSSLNKAEGHRIIELVCIPYVKDVLIEDPARCFYSKFNPHREIDFKAYKVHNIKNEDLENCPDFKLAAESLLRFCSNKIVFAHNAQFDVDFINEELRIAGYKERLEDVCLIVDTMQLAKQIIKSGYLNLDALANRFKVPNKDREFHSAYVDTILLIKVYQAMLNSYQEEMIDMEEKPTGNLFFEPLPELSFENVSDEEFKLANNLTVRVPVHVKKIHDEIILNLKSGHNQVEIIDDDDDDEDLDILTE